MATPRKRKTPQVYGSRVGPPPTRGRPARGSDFASLLVARIKAIKERLATRPTDRAAAWQKITWRSFAERIGLSEEALRLRLRRSAPTPFSNAELATICQQFAVRPAYLLLGGEPMLELDLVTHATAAPFADLLYRHMLRVLDVRTEQDGEWVASYLPDAQALLLAVENGVAEALASSVAASIADRKLANASVRLAVADRTRSATEARASSPEFFTSATRGALDATVIDLGENGDD